MLQWAFQLAVLAVVVGIVAFLVANVRNNSEQLGIPTGFGYLDNPAQFPIPDSDFRTTQPVRDALLIGLGNTLRVAVLGIVLSTILGTIVGVARLSGNWLVRNAARVYVETLRNIPLLLVIIFAYLGLALAVFPRIESAWEPLNLGVVSNRGVVLPWIGGGSTASLLLVVAVALVAGGLVLRWRRRVAERTGRSGHGGLLAIAVALAVVVAGWLLAGLTLDIPELDGRIVRGGLRASPEFFAICFALVIYTASHIAEIVRGSIQAVPRGQGEAGQALALSSYQRMRLVILPQALRTAVPPLGNQYLNLTKNTTLGAVVSYFELAQVTSISVGNGAPAVPSYLLTLVIFLMLSIVISAMVNWLNRRLAVVER